MAFHIGFPNTDVIQTGNLEHLFGLPGLFTFKIFVFKPTIQLFVFYLSHLVYIIFSLFFPILFGLSVFLNLIHFPLVSLTLHSLDILSVVTRGQIRNILNIYKLRMLPLSGTMNGRFHPWNPFSSPAYRSILFMYSIYLFINRYILYIYHVFYFMYHVF